MAEGVAGQRVGVGAGRVDLQHAKRRIDLNRADRRHGRRHTAEGDGGDGDCAVAAGEDQFAGGCLAGAAGVGAFHIAGGTTDTLAACRAIRGAAPDALIVVKRGPMGCTVFAAAIPDDLDAYARSIGLAGSEDLHAMLADEYALLASGADDDGLGAETG